MGQLQAWFVRMGRVAKPETLSTPSTGWGWEGGTNRSPHMQKNLGLCFDKESRKRCGKRESQFLQYDNAKVQVPSHGLAYLYLYAL